MKAKRSTINQSIHQSINQSIDITDLFEDLVERPEPSLAGRELLGAALGLDVLDRLLERDLLLRLRHRADVLRCWSGSRSGRHRAQLLLLRRKDAIFTTSLTFWTHSISNT